VGTDGEDRVEQEHALICPGCEKTTLIGWALEARDIFLARRENIDERGRCGRRRSDRETEPVRLVVVVVWVLAYHYYLHGV
jgi:hypothetical protein